MNNRLKSINSATNAKNFCETIESYILEEPAPRWWFLLHAGEVAKFIELAQARTPKYVDPNLINNHYTLGKKIRASLFVLLPEKSITREVIEHFDLIDLNIGNTFGLILENFGAKLDLIFANCKKPFDFETSASGTTPLLYMIENNLFSILNKIIRHSAKKIDLNKVIHKSLTSTVTLTTLLRDSRQDETIHAIEELNVSIRNIEYIQKICPINRTVKIEPSTECLPKKVENFRKAILTADLLALNNSEESFGEFDLEEHPFYCISAQQQKIIVDYFMLFIKVKSAESTDFFEWLQESTFTEENKIALTHNHISACLGDDFNTASNDRDYSGMLPIDYYFLSGILRTTKHAEEVCAKVEFTRLSQPFRSTGINYYFMKYPEKTPDLQAEIINHFGRSYPLWFDLLFAGSKDTFLKAAHFQNRQSNLLDANIKSEFRCDHAAALYTRSPRSLFTKEVMQYFKPFEVNAGRVTNGYLFSNLYHLLVHTCNEADIEFILKHKQETGIDFSAGQKSRNVATLMLEFGLLNLFLLNYSTSVSAIDLSETIYDKKTKTSVSIEEFLQANMKALHVKRIRAQNNLKFPEAPKPTIPKQTPVRPKTISASLNKLTAAAVTEPVVTVKNNSKESQARNLLEVAAITFNLKWEMTIIPDQGCLVTLAGERCKELLSCVEKATNACQQESNKIEFKASLSAIIRAFKFLPRIDTSVVKSITTETIYTTEMVKDMEAKLRHAFCQENSLIVRWDDVRKRFTINYPTKSWRIQELYAKSNAAIEVNFEDDFVNEHILPNIVEGLEEAKDVKAQHDSSNNELVVRPLKGGITPQAALHQKVFKMVTTKKIYTTKAPIVESPLPVAAQVQTAKSTQVNTATFFALPRAQTDSEVSEEAKKLITTFRQLCTDISGTHTNSFEFLNGKFIKKNKKFYIEFSLEARKTINNIESESLFQAIAGAVNSQLGQATAIVFNKRNNCCSLIINCLSDDLKAIKIENARTYFSATAVPAKAETSLQTASIATYVPADIIHGLNTSDHTFRSIQVFLLRPDSLPICDVRGITFNMMNACISKQDNLARHDANWRNNPWDRTETAAQYFKRKERQLDKILDLLDESQDFMFLQEPDILLYPKRATLADKEKHLKIQGDFYEKLARKSWSWCTTHGEGNRPLVTLYNKKRLKLTSAASVMEGSALECKFTLFAGDVQQQVTLTNIHLKYENNNNHYIDDYQAQQIKNDDFTVLGGDTNLKDGQTSMIFNNNVATNLLAIEKNASVCVTDRIEGTSVRRDIDTFSAVPTSTTKVRLIESVGEMFVYDDKKQIFIVVQSNPKFDYPDQYTHTSDVGSLCIYTKQNSPAEAVELQKLPQVRRG